MTLSYPLLPTEINFKENEITVLTVENRQEYRKIIVMLSEQESGQDGDFFLAEKFNQLDFAKYVHIVTDLFSMTFNTKKITSRIEQLALGESEQFSDKLHEIMELMNSVAFGIRTELPFEATFSELELPDGLIKLMGFKLDEEGMSFPEKIFEYAKLQRDFFGKKLIIFLNLRSCLSADELKLLYQNFFYEKLTVLIIETTHILPVLPEEKHIIIDEDLCIF